MRNQNGLWISIGSFAAGAVFTWSLGRFFFSQPQLTGGQRASCFLEGGRRPLFELNGKTYTLDDLPDDMHQSFLLAQIDAFRRMGDVVEEVAARASASQDDKIPLMKDILGKSWVTDADIEEYYNSSTNSFNKSLPLAQAREPIRSHLERQKTLAFVNESMQRLKDGKSFKNLIPVPCGPIKKNTVSGVSFVVAGTSGPTEIVLFSDFVSPQSRYAIASVNQFAELNKSNITIREVYVPSERDSASEDLARGAYCVNDQDNKLLDSYRMAAYQSSTLLNSKTDPAGKPESREKTLLEMARSVGANEEQFASCVKSHKAKEFVDESIATARAAGVSNAPAFFLYNRQIVLPGVSDPGKVLTEIYASINKK